MAPALIFAMIFTLPGDAFRHWPARGRLASMCPTLHRDPL